MKMLNAGAFPSKRSGNTEWRSAPDLRKRKKEERYFQEFSYSQCRLLTQSAILSGAKTIGLGYSNVGLNHNYYT